MDQLVASLTAGSKRRGEGGVNRCEKRCPGPQTTPSPPGGSPDDVLAVQTSHLPGFLHNLSKQRRVEFRIGDQTVPGPGIQRAFLDEPLQQGAAKVHAVIRPWLRQECRQSDALRQVKTFEKIDDPRRDEQRVQILTPT